MADRDLRSRLYTKKNPTKVAKVLRPKHPKQLAMTGVSVSAPQPESTNRIPIPNLPEPETFITEQQHAQTRPTTGISRDNILHSPQVRPQTGVIRPNTSMVQHHTPMLTAIQRTKPPKLVPLGFKPLNDYSDVHSPKRSGKKHVINEPPDITKNPIFRLKKSNFLVQIPDDFEHFKLDPIYSSDISDELWMDPSLIFNYIRLIRQKKFDEEFLYFHPTPATSRDPMNVYFLRFVPPDQVDKEHYYTLSTDGVTTYRGSVSEFSPLQQWIRECSTYLRTKEVGFFKNYEKWRSFTLLRSITRKNIIVKSRESINDTLFNEDPILRKALIAHQTNCASILKLSLVDVKSAQTLTLDQFIERQNANQTVTMDKLNKLLNSSLSEIITACDLTYERAGASNKDDDDSGVVLRKKEKSMKVINKKPGKHQKAIKKLGANDMMVYTQLATQQFCYKRLSRFIRLCDYILVRTLYNFVIQSAQQLADFLKPRVGSSGGDNTRLSTQVVIKNNELKFSPDSKQMITGISNIWNQLLQGIYKIPSFSHDQSLSQYSLSYPWENPAVPLTTIISRDSLYKQLLEKTTSRIENAFGEATATVNNYQKFLEAYIQNTQVFNIDEIHKQDPPASFYEENIAKYRQQIQEMDAIKSNVQVNLLLVILNNFADTIRPSPRNCLSALNALIPMIAEFKVNNLSEVISDALHMLRTDPNDIHVFITQLEFRRKFSNDVPEIQDKYKDCTNFYSLINSTNITVSDDSLVAYKELGGLINIAEGLAIAMKEEEDNKIKKWSPALGQLLQKLRADLLDLHYKTMREDVMGDTANKNDVILYLTELQTELTEMKERAEEVQHYQRACQMKVSPIDELQEVTNDLNLKVLLWTSNRRWEEKVIELAPKVFNQIDTEELTQELSDYTRIVMQLSTGLPDHPLVKSYKQSVMDYNSMLPVIVALSNKHFTTHHWTKLRDLTGLNFQEHQYKLSYFFEKNISQYVEQIESISNDASNEASLLTMLQEIISIWEKVEFTMIPHKDIKDFYLVGSIEDVVAQLEESQVQLSTIRSSRYVGAIKSQVDDISKEMNLMAKCFDYITQFQIAFNSLYKVFSSRDIQSELPTDTRELYGIETEYKKWGHHARDSPKPFKLCTSPKDVQKFEDYLTKTANIQKSLEAFLQKKRTAFPRFYFLSNENLLKIFAEARNPKAVQPFLAKLFDGIFKLKFSQNGQDILAMRSAEGEEIQLVKCQALGAIEVWMSSVEKAMRMTLHRIVRKGHEEYDTNNRIRWIKNQPAQVVSIVTQIYFAYQVEEALVSQHPVEELKKLREKLEEQLRDLAALVRTDLDPALRSGVVSLITLDVHSRDIVSELINYKIESVHDFEWTKRLRYIWDDETNRVQIHQGSAKIDYGYEYLGATSRLVVTPLTERCYLTLTSALQYFLGGSPAGPAGTGKTETVKDLSKAVGNFCVVFNCSDAVTVIQMESFFSGLAQTGAWACFDEFNRINSEVLSVIAEQVYAVQAAVAADLQQFEFCGQTIPLNPRCGVFITMNPGYAGRTELPDNLKSLFRPISMMVPDYAMIAEVVLYSEGFSNAKPLAQKVTQLYKLSSEMLSQQSHYDFGMRALKSVLVMAGASKRRAPDLNEDIILIRAMRDSNISKLLIDDTKLFDAIIGDLFPGVEFEEETFDEITAAIEKASAARNLQYSEFMTTKTIQLYQTIYIRHGVMLVGPTGGGKTTSRDILADALGLIGTPVQQKELNPKAVTLTDLYGAYNLSTGDWKNGLVGVMFTECAEADPEVMQWIIFDGPVDALWIENMNTVLDDNKLLSLANSDRIKMTDQMHILFEVGDLAQASPATVSRCGMVYYQPADLGWRPLVKKWIKEKPEKCHELLDELFEKTFDGALQCLAESCKTVVPPVMWNLASSLCSIFDAVVLDQDVDFDKVHEDLLPKRVSHIFAFAMCWSFSGIVDDSTRGDFDTFMRDMFERRINYPPRRMLFDYRLEANEDRFILWQDLIKDEEDSTSSVIPTSDTVKFSELLHILIKAKRPVLFLGESGCGKTSVIHETLNKNMNSLFSIMFTLSARTTAAQIQDLIESKLLAKRKTLFGPPEGKSGVLLIDDFNLPRPDTYWSQPPIEILRQVVNNHGVYNRNELYWTNIEDLTVVAAGVNTGYVTPRFLSRFTVMSMPAPTDTVLGRIFGTILNRFLKGFADPVKALSEEIVKACVTFYRRIKSELLPTPSKSHYTFNLRDVSRVIQGILMTDDKSLSDPNSFIQLWFHENLRVFSDRLVSEADRAHTKQTLFDIAKSVLHIKNDMNYYFGEEPMIWTDVLAGYGADGRLSYKEATSLSATKNALNTFKEMFRSPIVLFKECMEHVLRIVRVMRQPSGHMLLVGMGGTGKRTAARFAAFVSEMEIFQPQPAKGYDINSFRNDLKGLFRTAGVGNKPIMLLLTDEQIVSESFLEDINNVLNTGEVPGLFESEEYDQMVNELVVSMKKNSESLAYDSLCRKFTSNVMKNLHVVLALSPVGGKFRDRCRIFPSLVSCCTIDWYDPWPENALNNVADDFISKMDLEKYGDVKQKLATMATFAHTLVCKEAAQFQSELNRVYYVTPAVYIEFFTLFTSMLKTRSEELEQKKQQLEKGVEKLQETNEKVQEMEGELQSLRPLLVQKADQTNKLLEKLKVDREKVNNAHRVISAEEQTVKEVKAEATKLANDAQQDLDRALPLLQAALAAVEDLKNRKSDLAVVKTFVKPPQLVVEVMEAVCLLLGSKPDWSSAKQLLAQTDFFNRLLEVHNQPIPESVLMKIRSMEADPRFEIKKVVGVSESAACLFKWVTAIEKFVTESVRIAPKQKRRDEAMEHLREAEENLSAKQAELKDITEQLASLQKQYDDSRSQQKELQQKIEQCEYRLKNASQLTTALDSERVRWSENLVELSEKEKCLLGDTILIALHVAYIGPFSYPYRLTTIHSLIDKCKEIDLKISDVFLLENIASTPLTLREWQIEGLPQDSLSKQNGVLVTATRRWPLLIDPQGQGRKWLIGHSKIKIVRTTEPGFVTVIENAIRIGGSVLVEDVTEALDPGLQFILTPKFKKQGGRLSIKLSDKWIDYDPNFKLYLTTKLSNPQFLPDVFIQLSVINFSVTHEGLEEQLLSDVVLHEMPELEQQRSELIVNISKDQKQLSELMAQILHLLFTSTGNILDNEVLINTLHEAKDTSTQVAARLLEAENTEREITEKREVFRSVATRGSILYFVVLELPGIDSMYQYSLEFFKRIFNSVLDSTTENSSVEARCQAFIDRQTYSVFANVSRGLFTNHRTVFGFLIATALLKSTQAITEDEWRLFLRGPLDVNVENGNFPAMNPDCSDRVWMKCCALSRASNTFKMLPSSVSTDYDLWKPFIEGDSNEIPDPFNKLTSFQKIILCSCIVRRKVVSFSRMLVKDTLGDEFIAQVSADLTAPFNDTSNDTPLLFVLSQGADPRESLERLAQKIGAKLNILSLGQGRGPTATSLVQQSKINGQWVFLQNCHLCPSFLPDLEQIIQEMGRTASKFHSGFRLFLSSMPTDVFPISVLRNSVKVTAEPPSGIKSNVGLLLSTLSSEEWEGCPKQRPWKKLLYSLAIFHSTIQERKRFGALGFNKVYEWSTSDFSIAAKMLNMYLSQNEEIPWQALRSMIGEVVYGGRVTDDWDRRCMNSMLDKFLCARATGDNIAFDPGKNYASAPLESLEKTIEFSQNLPDEDLPEIFGLHPSALNSQQNAMSNQMISWIVNVQPRDAGGDTSSRDDEVVYETAEDLSGKLPHEIITKNPAEGLFTEGFGGRPNSLTVVLMQEIDRFNRLLKLIHSSLKHVCRAIKGEVVMSIDIADVYHCLLENRVPGQWREASYPSTKPLISWFNDLVEKVSFIQKWYNGGQPNVFWFPGFFFPQAFLTAVLQSHSRKHSLPIDRLSFAAKIINQDPDSIVSAPEDGVYITGLFFDGARWNGLSEVLEDGDPKVEYAPCPVIHLIPKENLRHPLDEYLCPVYRTAERAGVLSTTGHSTNFVVAISLPTNDAPERWTLRGAALLTATPY